MVNLYQLLGLDMQATPEAIQAAIAREQALGNINPEVLEKASAWLLDAPTRARYDAQLRSSDASVAAAIPDLELSPRHTTPNLMTAKPASIQQPQPASHPVPSMTGYGYGSGTPVRRTTSGRNRPPRAPRPRGGPPRAS